MSRTKVSGAFSNKAGLTTLPYSFAFFESPHSSIHLALLLSSEASDLSLPQSFNCDLQSEK